MHWLLQQQMHVHVAAYTRGRGQGGRGRKGGLMKKVHTGWRKSGRSNPSGNCVELAALPGAVIAVRDSKDPAGPRLVLRQAEFRAFLTRLKDA